ncbi:MAG: poly-gamma-glutamate system protein [Ignavibacterium sp.]|jgi:poly-gamma-glutamate system protein|nr:poly-gamma-glutamate system protein [Ignavibacterium sp.]
MYQFSAKSKRVLTVLTVFSLVAFIVVEHYKVDFKRKWYDQKLEASQLAKSSFDYLKNYHLQKGVFIDAINDPNETALIGQDITPITTDRGYIEAKLTALNPNFAAVIVEMLNEADIMQGDNVAVAFTGSIPGLNVCVISALQTLKLNPIIITSVGSSNWGANNPDFTWLDMERILFDAGIFKYKSIAASIGGGLDRGRGLSPEGRDLIYAAIKRNNVLFINEEYLERSIEKRMEIYKKYADSKSIKAFINVGGGIASLGSIENTQFIPSGLIKSLPVKNYPSAGVLLKMADKKIPVIHLLNVNQLAEKYGLPVSPKPIPLPGSGEVFVKKQYNVLLTIIVTSILIVLIVTVFMLEQKRHKMGTEQVEIFKHSRTNNIGEI